MIRLSPAGIGKIVGERGGWGADEKFSDGSDEFELFIRHFTGPWVMVLSS